MRLRALVGAEHFYHGIPNKQFALLRGMLQILRGLPLRTPSQQEVARADAVLLLGEDVSNVAPMLALALRQAVLQAPAGDHRAGNCKCRLSMKRGARGDSAAAGSAVHHHPGRDPPRCGSDRHAARRAGGCRPAGICHRSPAG